MNFITSLFIFRKKHSGIFFGKDYIKFISVENCLLAGSWCFCLLVHLGVFRVLIVLTEVSHLSSSHLECDPLLLLEMGHLSRCLQPACS